MKYVVALCGSIILWLLVGESYDLWMFLIFIWVTVIIALYSHTKTTEYKILERVDEPTPLSWLLTTNCCGTSGTDMNLYTQAE